MTEMIRPYDRIRLKAPEMAELLIELAEISCTDDGQAYWDIVDQAKELLKEIGYEAEND